MKSKLLYSEKIVNIELSIAAHLIQNTISNAIPLRPLLPSMSHEVMPKASTQSAWWVTQPSSFYKDASLPQKKQMQQCHFNQISHPQIIESMWEMSIV